MVKVVEVLAVFDLDGEGAGNAFQLAGSGAWHNNDLHFGAVLIHGGQVLKSKAALFSVERSGDHFDSHVAGCPLLRVSACKHLAFRCRFQIAVDFLVDGIAAEALCGRGGEGAGSSP